MNLSINADPQSSSAAENPARPLAGVGVPLMRFDKKTIYMSAVRGTTGVGYSFVIQNRGTTSFKLVDESFIFSGDDASLFQITGGRTLRTVQPGAKALYRISFKPGAQTLLDRVATATLSIKASRASGVSGKINLRAIATQGEGGNLEPSLQRLMDLYGYTIDVGDTDPSTTTLDLDGSATDEVYAPTFNKSGTGPVSITPIAQFVSDAPVPGRLGYYTPGSPDDRTELFSLKSAFNQAAAPEENGTTIFDPGSSPFSVYAQIPVFVDDGEPRRIYGEDALNTWEPNANNRRKVRVYQLSESGKKVDGAYVVTFEDFTTNDQNDYVYVIRGVTPEASGPEIGLLAQNNQPNASVLSFNEIGQKNTSTPNRVYNSATVRIVNTGNRDLTISNISIGSGAANFAITAGGGAATIARNGTRDVTVFFNANSGDIKTGTLVINSNDKDEATTTVALNGFWQSVSESDGNGVNQEPFLPELLKLFDYGTQAIYNGQSFDTDGRTEAVGDEVLASYFKRADGSYPVKVTDLSTFHSQGSTDEVAWVEQGKPFYGNSDPRKPTDGSNGPRNTLFFTNTSDGQTLFPRASGGGSAVATFATDLTFGFRVSGEFSDDSLNIRAQGEQGGHHWRFYPARKADGSTIPNTYLAVMDFSAINYDYNDNLLLIENVRPVDRPESVTGLAAYDSSGDAVLGWADIEGATRYTVSRATSANGTYSVINSNVKESFFVDSSVSDDTTYYYRVAAVNAANLSGLPTQTRVAIG